MSNEAVTDATRPGRTLAARIDLACDQFEAALRAGTPVKIEEYVAQFEGPFRASLLHELLMLEVGYRRGRGDSIDGEEYRRRFPDRIEIVQRVLGADITQTIQGEQTAETIVSTSRFVKLRFHDSGGLGDVFKAEDVQLKRDVALKFIQPRHGSDPTCVELFLTEAEITSRLDHPGVVPVYGLGESWDGRPFYAMRLVQGARLREEIERFHREGCARLELHRLVSHLVSVCGTVAYAHNRGIVHRDIKPENIMIGRFQEITLLDWGLAIGVQRDERARSSGEKTMLVGRRNESSSVTGAGTIGYMSPEQLPNSDAPIGTASDVYSLGATLYKILTGKPAFQSKHLDVFEEIRLGRFLPPRELYAAVAPPLEAICLKAMATQPHDRYAGALEMAADLQAWLADEPVSVYHEPWIERWNRWGRLHRNLLLYGLVTAAALVFAAFFSAAHQRHAAIVAGEAREVSDDAKNQAVEARREAESAQETSMRMTARFAAKTIATEIDLRWRILSEHAADNELHECLLALAQTPQDPAMQRRLQDWLAFRRDGEATTAESWFIDDAVGTQVARSPRADSIGKNFRGRDYFHGGGRDLPAEDATETEPITTVHRSTVYQSSNDKSLRVAFTVPIWPHNDPMKAPIGVLGMSIELGKFAALRTGLASGQSAALIDLREDGINEPGRGLILHHPALQEARERRMNQDPPDTAPFRIEASRIEGLQTLTKQRLGEPPHSNSLPLRGSLDPNYRDPFSGRTMTAVFEPVLVDSRADAGRDTGWIVVIQQEHARN